MSLYTTQTLKTSATHLRTPGLVADQVWSIAVEAMTRFTWGPIRDLFKQNILKYVPTSPDLSRLTVP